MTLDQIRLFNKIEREYSDGDLDPEEFALLEWLFQRGYLCPSLTCE